MKKFFIWFSLCALMIALGQVTGYRWNNFIAGFLFSACMWIPATMIEEWFFK